jgi:hypothetical protein
MESPTRANTRSATPCCKMNHQPLLSLEMSIRDVRNDVSRLLPAPINRFPGALHAIRIGDRHLYWGDRVQSRSSHRLSPLHSRCAHIISFNPMWLHFFEIIFHERNILNMRQERTSCCFRRPLLRNRSRVPPVAYLAQYF